MAKFEKKSLRRARIIAIICSVLVAYATNAQSLYKTLGAGAAIEYGSAIAVAADGKIVIGGSYNNQCFISLLDSSASSVLWTRTFTLDSSYLNQVSHLYITPDNYIIGTTDILCNAPKFCGTGYFKLNFAGTVLFNNSIVSPANNFTLKKIFPISASSYIAVGMNYAIGGTQADWKFFKINSVTGNISYQTGLIDEDHSGLSNYLDDIFSTTTLHNNHFYFSGRIYASGTGAETMRPNIVKMDTNFTVVWSNYYFKDITEDARIYPFDLEAYDDTLIVAYAGDKDGIGPDFSCGLIKLLSDGTVLWQKDFDLSNSVSDHPSKVIVTTDGYLIYGISNFLSSGNRDFYLIKTNRNGTILWSKTIGHSATNEQAATQGYSSAQLVNNFLYFTGETNLGNDKIVIGKASISGAINCIPSTSQTCAITSIPNFQHANTQRIEIPNTVSVISVQTFNGSLNTTCFSFSLGKDTTLCSSINFNLQAPIIPGAQYLWSNGDTSTSITVLDSGIYSLRINNNCCSFTDSIRIKKIAGQQKNQHLLLCAGDTLQVGNNFHSAAGIYVDTLKTFYGCDSIVTTQLGLYPTHFFVSKTLCEGDSIFFKGKYLKTPGNYTDTLSSFLGCDSIIELTLLLQETGQLYVTGDTLLCKGDSSLLIAHGAQSYQWLPLNNLQIIDVNTVLVAPLTNTNYTLIGTNGACSDSSYFQIEVLTNPKINPQYSIIPCTWKVQFQNKSSGVENCWWNFGDGYLSNLCAAMHEYENEGNYQATCTIEFTNGCSETSSIFLDVSAKEGNGSITNANYFTPDNDGIEDVFYFTKGIACDLKSFEIYSVLGQLIYRSEAVEKGWNGTNMGGAMCIFGTYFYLVKSESKNYSGFVELIR